MPIGVIDLAFDPIVRLGDLEIRAQTVALAGTFLIGLLLLAWFGRRTPQPGPYVPPPPLRLDEIPFLVLGIVPGAVIGGRLDQILVHLDYYAAHPLAVFDPAQGSLGLGLAVPGALLGGAAIARLVNAPVDRWMHAAAVPSLFVLGAGKLAGLLAAEGQGLPSDLPWATAYHGPGPWASLAPDIASHPAGAYEAIGTLVAMTILMLALRIGAFSRLDGAALLAGICLWLLARAGAAFAWRDAAVAGPLRAEHLVLAVVLVACVVVLVRIGRSGRSREVVHSRTSA